MTSLSLTGTVPPAGWERRPRYRWVTVDLVSYFGEGDPDPDAEPFRMEVRTNLTNGELDEITLDGSLTYEELWTRIAPLIRSWNVLRRDVTTGELLPVPPPMTAGPEALAALTGEECIAVALAIKAAPYGGEERKKDSLPPVSSPAGTNGAGSASPLRTTRKRSRAGSSSPSGSTSPRSARGSGLG